MGMQGKTNMKGIATVGRLTPRLLLHPKFLVFTSDNLNGIIKLLPENGS